ncbi:MAG: sulfite exporter TauE/SafE family protein [Rhodobacteraceae bacterium]|nr:sulfite exporter TauE/SafE family protein [Paracoccaceae bacterium]
MTGMLADMGTIALLASLSVVAMAGFVKGAVGFALPMILVSGLGSFLPAEIVVAAVILPTVATNLVQAFRTGMRHAWASFRSFWRFNLIVFATILASAQLLSVIPDRVLFLMLGVMIVVFTTMQLAGWRPVIRAGLERVTEVSVALVAGFVGGLTGVWGPPTILYLTALDVPKAESVRVQGVMYLVGSILLTLAHLKSGVLNPSTIPYSALLILPALAGQVIGLKVHDRMDQALFRRATLVVLIIAGANLVRRGLSL